MKSFTNDCPRKRYVQEELFRIAGFNHQATVLIGPNPNKYIKLLNKFIVCVKNDTYLNNIFGYEKNQNIDLKGVTSNVSIIKKDIAFSKPTTFIDLDLCGTLTCNKYLMYHLFLQQKAQLKEKRSFMVTFSLRTSHGTKLKDVFDSISEMIDRKITYKSTKVWINLSQSVREYTIFTSKEYQIYAYSYCDDSPMISILIKY